MKVLGLDFFPSFQVLLDLEKQFLYKLYLHLKNSLYVIESAYNSQNYWTAAVQANIVSSDNINTDVSNKYVGAALYGTVSACKESYYNTLTTSFWKHG